MLIKQIIVKGNGLLNIVDKLRNTPSYPLAVIRMDPLHMGQAFKKGDLAFGVPF